jgi:glycosyltransferase involved in cell wall biosynthesis
MQRVCIDVTHIKPKKIGGLESVIRNTLDGLYEYHEEFEYTLMTTRDNAKTFKHYLNKKNFKMHVFDFDSSSTKSRIYVQNTTMLSYFKRENFDLIYIPQYSMPILYNGKTPIMINVHDLQPLHYPENFTKGHNKWYRFCWPIVCKKADAIVTISNFVRDDLIHSFHVDPAKVVTIYNAINSSQGIEDFETIKDKYGIEKENYFYTVSSLHKHKNIITLLKLIHEIKANNLDLPHKLIISGISAGQKDEINQLLAEYDIEKEVALTGFVSNEERNSLIANAGVFLFASVFEGFGMPPIEAMELGTRVVTTRCSCIPEVTHELADYVSDPYDTEEWIKVIRTSLAKPKQKQHFEEYTVKYAADQYAALFHKLIEK